MSTFAKKISRVWNDRPHRVIRVPEWDLDIYVWPMTLGQLSRIREEKDEEKQILRILLVRARDEKGELLFDAEDIEAFFSQGVGRYGPDVVKEVVAKLGDVDYPDEAQDEKN